MKHLILFLAMTSCQRTVAQKLDIDLFGGISNYQGDLQPLFFTLQNANAGGAVILKYGITPNFYARAGFSFGSLAGYDSKNKPELQSRNLDFRSKLSEFHAGLEYRLIRPDKFAVTPYFFAGVGVFSYNPYTYHSSSTAKIYLQPLSTEGQGLAGYPDRKPYDLTQLCIPYGLGLKWQVNCNLNVGVEFRQTKVFSDYLDDVSKTYVNETELRDARGQIAVDLAWRTDEFNGRPYPSSDINRGNAAEDDWYYFAGITVGLKLNDCETGGFSLGGLFKGRGNSTKLKSKVDCPKVY
jgi:opacity protein-like surface antigen